MKDTAQTATIYDFLECKYRQNYDVLAEKDTEKPVKSEVFDVIFEQFVALTGSRQYTLLLNEMNELIRLNDVVLQCRAALTILGYRYEPEQAEILKKHGFNFNFDVYDVEIYLKNIKKCWSLLKGVELKIQVAIKKIEELQKESRQDQTESEFLEGVGNVSKFMGFRIPIKETTLSEYASYIKINNSQKSGK